LLVIARDDKCGNPAPAPRIFNITNEIANDFKLAGLIVRDFNGSELISDLCQQFQTIKPVGPEIVTEVRFVSDATNVDVEMLGNNRANFACFQAFITRDSWSEADAGENHDKPPGIIERPTFDQAILPTI
jgi:hypothetical protein